ncbi:MAG: hypothetical protein B6A08_20465 [Sorangiineae bacterium NIC37A_2]|nr:MAG: hypothetical protein B6A08_20465 [Sorangiineae bacterium NIC37A_2]
MGLSTYTLHESKERSLSYSWPGALLSKAIVVIVREGDKMHAHVTRASTVDEAEERALEAEAGARNFRGWPRRNNKPHAP